VLVVQTERFGPGEVVRVGYLWSGQ
jgi:hypothetical protein